MLFRSHLGELDNLLREQLDLLIRSRTPILWIRSQEEERCAALLSAAARRLGDRSLARWDFITGLSGWAGRAADILHPSNTGATISMSISLGGNNTYTGTTTVLAGSLVGAPAGARSAAASWAARFRASASAGFSTALALIGGVP